jgi:hypothetical protein
MADGSGQARTGFQMDSRVPPRRTGRRNDRRLLHYDRNDGELG